MEASQRAWAWSTVLSYAIGGALLFVLANCVFTMHGHSDRHPVVEVTVVDEYGAPVSGVELVFEHGSRGAWGSMSQLSDYGPKEAERRRLQEHGQITKTGAFGHAELSGEFRVFHAPFRSHASEGCRVYATKAGFASVTAELSAERVSEEVFAGRVRVWIEMKHLTGEQPAGAAPVGHAAVQP